METIPVACVSQLAVDWRPAIRELLARCSLPEPARRLPACRLSPSCRYVGTRSTFAGESLVSKGYLERRFTFGMDSFFRFASGFAYCASAASRSPPLRAFVRGGWGVRSAGRGLGCVPRGMTMFGCACHAILAAAAPIIQVSRPGALYPPAHKLQEQIAWRFQGPIPTHGEDTLKPPARPSPSVLPTAGQWPYPPPKPAAAAAAAAPPLPQDCRS